MYRITVTKKTKKLNGEYEQEELIYEQKVERLNLLSVIDAVNRAEPKEG